LEKGCGPAGEKKGECLCRSKKGFASDKKKDGERLLEKGRRRDPSGGTATKITEGKREMKHPSTGMIQPPAYGGGTLVLLILTEKRGGEGEDYCLTYKAGGSVKD